MEPEEYGLDLHCTMILEEYEQMLPVFKKMKEIVLEKLRTLLKENNILVTAVDGRVKTEKSLAGKLELKGAKYRFLSDLTDIFGARVITFYSDEVDKIAALIENNFDIDWNESVDKRKMHELNSFGYMSLHYICRIPKSVYHDDKMPEINEYRFEIQMRTTLQHAWASIYHDNGYKTDVEVPQEYIRTLNRLAGMLELADDEFSRIRTALNEYRYKIQNLLRDGKFAEIKLDGDSFARYLELNPFKRLTDKIAAINQAEIHPTTTLPYLKILQKLGFKTLGDIETLKNNYWEDAYQLALHQIGGTDLDIVTSTIGLQNLCIVYQLKNNVGIHGLTKFFDTLNGETPYNQERAKRLIESTKDLPFLKK
ncbi:MAG: hypothetical protein MJY52_03955 [Bacteroidaceae bacterium]|nr:hypothetical protein [Bacteroidaceae bacterium]